MEAAVSKKMLPLTVSALLAGLVAIVTSKGSHARQLLAKEVLYYAWSSTLLDYVCVVTVQLNCTSSDQVSRQMSSAITVVTV